MINYRTLLESAVKTGGDFALLNQDKAVTGLKLSSIGDSSYKEEKIVFSQIDIESQKLIMSEIGSKLHRRARLIAEESDKEIENIFKIYYEKGRCFDKNSLTVIIDPIDGSKNYLSKERAHETLKRNYWGVSVAIAEGKELISGAIYCPALGVILSSEKGRGTFLNGKKIDIKDRKYEKKDIVRISGSHPKSKHYREIFPDDKDFYTGSFICTSLSLIGRNSGNRLLKSLNLNHYSSYIGNNCDVCDLASIPLILEEAGGFVSGLDGKKVNPFAKTLEKKGTLRQEGDFILAPGKKYVYYLINFLKSRDDRWTD